MSGHRISGNTHTQHLAVNQSRLSSIRDSEREADILRKIRTILDGEAGAAGERLKNENLRNGRRIKDFGEEEFEKQRLGNFEECTLVGFEFKKGEECREVKEVDCYDVNVTKYRTDLRERCTSLVDQKCGLVTIQVVS